MFLALALAACAGPGTASAPWCGTPDGDVPTAVAGAADRPLALEEVWRAGGLREGEVLGGRPFPPAVRADGWVAVPDPGLGRVPLVSPEGDWTPSPVEEGDGPGEVRAPVTARWSEAGTLLLLDPVRGRVLEVAALSGTGVGETPLPADAMARVAASGQLRGAALGGGGRILLEMPPEDVPEPSGGFRTAVVAYGPGREGAADTLLTVAAPGLGGALRHMAAPGFPRPLFAAGPRGAVAVAGDEPRYRVRILDAAGRDSLRVCRTVAPTPLRPDEAGEVEVEGLEALPGLLAAAPRPDRPAAVGRIFFGAGGRLWVQRERPAAHEIMDARAPSGARYDVFAPGGRYEGTVRAPAGAEIHGEGGGLVVGFERGALGETSVVAWRIREP